MAGERPVESRHPMRPLLIRFGLCALGLLYVAMGIVSARVAWLGAREPQGVGGALRLLLDDGRGRWLLAAVAAGLGALAVARTHDAFRGKRGVFSRVALVVDALGYAVLCWTAVALLLHLRARGGPSLTRTGAAWLLSESWGPAVLEIAGIVVALGGLRELWMGLSGRLSNRPDAAPKHIAKTLVLIARFGLAARGLVLCALGYYIVRAAEKSDPSEVRTMGGTLRQFEGAPLGAVVVGVLAVGLAAYGIYLAALGVAKRRV
jgi:hypothetical protein